MNINIMGNVAVLTFGVKIEDVQKLKKYNREALVLRDEDKNAVLMFDIASGNGDVFGRSINLDHSNHSAHATVTVDLTGVEDAAQFVADKLIGQDALIARLENQVRDAVVAIDSEIATVKESIRYVDAAEQ